MFFNIIFGIKFFDLQNYFSRTFHLLHMILPEQNFSYLQIRFLDVNLSLQKRRLNAFGGEKTTEYRPKNNREQQP